MIKLFRCKICGDPYIGDKPPGRCPFCGAYENFIVESKDYNETFDVELTEIDKANAEHALEVEISNSQFYFCAADNIKDEEGKKLFKALAKIEAEHASIWKKILKISENEYQKMKEKESCKVEYKENLQESHDREERAIEFYKTAAKESDNIRVKTLFAALVQVETDHLQLSEQRL